MLKGLRRFFVEKLDPKDNLCSITGPEARHISKVLRMRPGDRFILMNGKGSRHMARIETSDPRQVRVLLERPLPNPAPSPIKITICQSLIKPRPMDYLIQKTSELGVFSLCPFYSKRTVIKIKGDRLNNKIRHWREIAQNAATQSDRDMPAKIEYLLSFEELLDRCKRENAAKVILWEEDAQDFKVLLRSSPSADTFFGLVGPEGGFTRDEIDAAGDAGFVPVSLGDRILRSETAAITMVAIVQYEWGDLSMNGPDA